MKEQLKISLAQSIAAAVSKNMAAIQGLLEAPKNKAFGDVAFPCFLLAKEQKTSPMECAKRLAEELKLPEGIKEAVPAGPYINFRFDTANLAKQTIETFLAGDKLFTVQRAERILVEYSSPNIAKPFHVGHLRATLIGNCLDRVYRCLKYPTISINHLGDWGTQFGFVYAGCKLWGKPENNSVIGLLEIYRRATDLKAAQEDNAVTAEDKNLPNINEMARSYFVDLENGEPYAEDFWKWCLSISLEYLKATYKRFDIEFDFYTGESFYRDKMDAVKEELDRAGILRESQGAIGVDLGEELGFARIYTPDGRSLYLTRDLAAAMYRAARYEFNRCMYVVGAPQALHFNQLKEILRRLGHA